ncbi:glycosyltransferase family 4 protein [Neorhodopirellula pilleata]|nr:glycosyltransferase family 4 protein [Neorhodopirellula pilleata]
MQTSEITSPLKVRAVFLTHYIPLYQVRVLQELTQSLDGLKILLSTPIEPNRQFRPDWSGLDVDVQNTITLRRRWKHRAAGFTDPLFVHVPYDTKRRLKTLSPDVVISHELGARSIAAARYCRRSGTKLILATFMSEHTEQGRGWFRRRVRQRLIRQADAITYNGPSCRDYLIGLGADPSKLFHAPYAADDRHWLLDPPPRDEAAVRRRLICIGQLTDRKGVLQLVRQADQFCRDADERLEITFVGDGPLRSDLEQLARGQSISLQSALDTRLQINVLGNQPASRLPELMQQHGALVAPTLADEWLLVVNEAMHAGMPVIGSVYAQAVTTLVDDDQNGWRYNPLHTSGSSGSGNGDCSLALVLRRYLDAEDQAITGMRRQAQKTVAPYTPARSAAGFIDAIRKVGESS